jgi:hypothetical protein
MDKLKSDEKNYFEIERMLSKKSFAIMEAFTFSIDDPDIRNRLVEALEGKKPFANFKNRVHSLPEKYRNEWFAFKLEEDILWIRKQLELNWVGNEGY